MDSCYVIKTKTTTLYVKDANTNKSNALSLIDHFLNLTD